MFFSRLEKQDVLLGTGLANRTASEQVSFSSHFIRNFWFFLRNLNFLPLLKNIIKKFPPNFPRFFFLELPKNPIQPQTRNFVYFLHIKFPQNPSLNYMYTIQPFRFASNSLSCSAECLRWVCRCRRS